MFDSTLVEKSTTWKMLETSASVDMGSMTFPRVAVSSRLNSEGEAEFFLSSIVLNFQFCATCRSKSAGLEAPKVTCHL